MFCSHFNLTTFSLMFFPLFSKVFTDILRIYELPKIYNKNTEILPNTSLNNNHLPDQFYLPTSSGFWAIPLLTLLKMCPGRQRTHFCGGRKRSSFCGTPVKTLKNLWPVVSKVMVLLLQHNISKLLFILILNFEPVK